MYYRGAILICFWWGIGYFFVISAVYVTFLLVVLSCFLYLCTRNKALAENGKNKKIRIGACPHPLQAT